MRRGAGWSAAACLVAAVVVIPLAAVAARLLLPAGSTWAHFSATVLPGYLRGSVMLVTGVTLLATVVGVATAWLVATCDFPGRRLLDRALVLPLAVPAFLAAHAWSGMLDVTGPAQALIRTLVPAAGDRFLQVQLLGPGAAIVILAAALYPYVFLTARTAFRDENRTFLEAARTLGHTPGAVFRRIALPLARPAIAAGAALVAMEALADYGASRYLGVTTLTTGVFRAWFGFGDVDAAARLAAMLMVAVLAVLLLERALRGRARWSGGEAVARPVARRRLVGGGRWLAVLACGLPVLVGFVGPVAQFTWWAARTARTEVGPAFLRLAGIGVGLALAAAVLAVLVALLLGWAVRLTRGAAVRAAVRVAGLGYAMPGAVVAVGILGPVGLLDEGLRTAIGAITGTTPGLLLGGSVAALLFAYLVRFLTVAHLPIEAGLAAIPTSADDAARTLGAAPRRVLRRVVLPLLAGPVGVALLFVFVDVLKELPITLALRPFNVDTLATRAFQLAIDERPAQAAPYALAIVLVGLVPVVLLDRLVGPRRAR